MSARACSSRSLLACTVLAGSLVLGMAGISGAKDATVAPRTWAKSVCTALAAWTDDMETAAGAVKVDATSAPPAVKTALTKLFKQAQRGTKRLTRALNTAGAPKVNGGKEIAVALRDDLAGVPAAIAAARTTLAKLPTDDATAFATGASAAYTSVTTALTAVETALDEQADLYTSAPLQKALKATRACRKLVNP